MPSAVGETGVGLQGLVRTFAGRELAVLDLTTGLGCRCIRRANLKKPVREGGLQCLQC